MNILLLKQVDPNLFSFQKVVSGIGYVSHANIYFDAADAILFTDGSILARLVKRRKSRYNDADDDYETIYYSATLA